MRTYVAKPQEIQREWFVIDAAGKPIGRVAAKVAHILRGKHKPIFSPHIDVGDHVIVVNAAKVVLTGNKAEEPIYRHSGWPGGLKTTTRGKMLQTKPEQLMRRAIEGMLPHNTLGRRMAEKLKVYAGPDHPHAAQMPKVLEW